MSVQTGANSKIYIATTWGAAPANQGAYEALTWVEIEQTESIGEFGDSTAEVNFTGLGDARVQKLKGSSNAGTISLAMAFNEVAGESPLTGQGHLLLASENTTVDNYAFKVTYDDGTTDSPLGDGSTRYFAGQVGGFTEGVPGADNVLMVSSDIRINTAIIRVART